MAKKYDDLPPETTLRDAFDLEHVLKTFPASRTIVEYVCESCGAGVRKLIQHLRKHPKLLCRECLNEEKTGSRRPSKNHHGRAKGSTESKPRSKRRVIYRLGGKQFSTIGQLAVEIWKRDMRSEAWITEEAAIDYIAATRGEEFFEKTKTFADEAK